MDNADLLRPDATDCRTRLLRAAQIAFRDEGYRVSIDHIAARAGVAKQTVYNHFPTKAELFREVVRHAAADLLVALTDDGAALRARLLRFATAYRERVLQPQNIALYGSLAGEARRFPELASAFYSSGPGQTRNRLAAVLATAMKNGEIQNDDPHFAADVLLAMLVGGERTRRLFLADAAPSGDAIATDHILDIFLRAFAPVPRNTP